ncbi:hypothetical protein, partial [Lysinibacillus sp. NPDC093688]|uniref:hypothetical protein n=1 Tax=Lysinibacillus sp. NPDC093688 TaxID=3390577 RepID=UPI003CFEEB00
RSVSNKCFICAKAKRQQQMFYLCESEASATKRVARSGNQPPRINRMYKNGYSAHLTLYLMFIIFPTS